MKKALHLCAAFAFVRTSSALMCFQCNKCKIEDHTLSSCLAGFDVCMTSRLSGRIRKSCAPSALCNVENIDRTSLDPNKNAKGIFSDHNMKKMMKANLYTKGKLVKCCAKDFCNGSSRKMVNFCLLCILQLALLLKLHNIPFF